MFDSSLCNRTLVKVPLSSHWLQVKWLNLVLIFIIIVSVFLGYRWLTGHPQWKRLFNKPKLFFRLMAIAISLTLVFSLSVRGVLSFLQTDPGTTADAIVVLGRGAKLMGNRAYPAADLWKAGRAPKLFASGKGDAARLVELMESRGIPKEFVDGENCSLTTEENALFSAAILQPKGVRQIILVTDWPHMMRSRLVFRASGFKVIPHATSLSPHMNLKEKAFLTFREVGGLFGYGLEGMFFKRHSSEEFDSPKYRDLLQKAHEYSQQQAFQR